MQFKDIIENKTLDEIEEECVVFEARIYALEKKLAMLNAQAEKKPNFDLNLYEDIVQPSALLTEHRITKQKLDLIVAGREKAKEKIAKGEYTCRRTADQ